MLRGCTLRNIPYCYGICCYVGEDTKIMNNKKSVPKTSYVMKMMNYMLLTVFVFQILIIIVYMVISMTWIQKNQKVLVYLPIQVQDDIAVGYVIKFFTFWVAYSHMIPISLYVFIEMLKLTQQKMINNDVRMFFAEDMNFASCRNSDLVEELG